MTPAQLVAENLVDLVQDGDWEYVATHMRAADRAELTALGMDPGYSLVNGIELSELAFTVRTSGRPAAIFGVTKPGAVWLLGTDGIVAHRYWFLRNSSRWTELLHTVNPVLWNWVDKRNVVHINWLRWLGFSFHEEAPLGRNDEPFLYFSKVKH